MRWLCPFRGLDVVEARDHFQSGRLEAEHGTALLSGPSHSTAQIPDWTPDQPFVSAVSGIFFISLADICKKHLTEFFFNKAFYKGPLPFLPF